MSISIEECTSWIWPEAIISTLISISVWALKVIPGIYILALYQYKLPSLLYQAQKKKSALDLINQCWADTWFGSSFWFQLVSKNWISSTSSDFQNRNQWWDFILRIPQKWNQIPSSIYLWSVDPELKPKAILIRKLEPEVLRKSKEHRLLWQCTTICTPNNRNDHKPFKVWLKFCFFLHKSVNRLCQVSSPYLFPVCCSSSSSLREAYVSTGLLPTCSQISDHT